MAMADTNKSSKNTAKYHDVNSAYTCAQHGPNENTSLLSSAVQDDQDIDRYSREVARPCYYILQILGMWKPRNGRFRCIWGFYRRFALLMWLLCFVAIMCLDFVHYGFGRTKVHVREITNSACTCLDFLCPFMFTLYYFKYGQFVQLVSSVQSVSREMDRKLRIIARGYTILSLLLWSLCATFFMVHWFPFFTKSWQYIIYITVVIYISGWWGTWLTVYGYVCHVHSLQINAFVKDMKQRRRLPITILQRYFQLQNSVERTQKDFNVIISLAIMYHTLDLIVFSFAYFNSAFGKDYPLWQFVGTVLFDLTSLIFKLYPPAMVAAAAHHIVLQASKRCHLHGTATATQLLLEDMKLFQYVSLCEPDMGLKILGIRITVELAMKLLMAIATVAVSFIVFVIPRLK